MLSIIYFLLILSAGCWTAEQTVPISRLDQPKLMVAAKAMTTVVSFLTTIPTCSFTTSCAITNGAVTACRRLRRDFDIDSILPSHPQLSVETTTAPAPEVATFVPIILSSSDEPRDVVVNGLLPGGGCGAGPFGVTIVYTRTIISEVTCLSSVTHTNTFTLAGCTPANIVYCLP